MYDVAHDQNPTLLGDRYTINTIHHSIFQRLIYGSITVNTKIASQFSGQSYDLIISFIAIYILLPKKYILPVKTT